MTWVRGPRSTFELPIFDKARFSTVLCLTANLPTRVRNGSKEHIGLLRVDVRLPLSDERSAGRDVA
jgi:hypothetical protein